MIRWICKVAPILALVQLFTTAAIFTNTVNALAAEPPFVICDKQRYALCAAADCFVYNGLAYCKCDVLHGDSISLQLSYTTPAGETQNICDVNQQGTHSGYMMSTFSLPAGVEKGGDSAVYTCPGTANAGSGVAATVASVSKAAEESGFPVSRLSLRFPRLCAPAQFQPTRRRAAPTVSDTRSSARIIRRRRSVAAVMRTRVPRAACPLRPPMAPCSRSEPRLARRLSSRSSSTDRCRP